MTKSKPKFVRTDSSRSFKLGRNRKKLQVWRGAKGKHSKIRKQRKGYPKMPSIGFASPRKGSGKVNNLTPMLVHNVPELEKINNASQAAIIARVGARKKLELLKKASDLGIKILNAGGKK